MPIHSTAIVDGRAEIEPTAEIGPYVVIDGPVVVGAGTRVLAHAVIEGHTSLGRENVVHPGAVLGGAPQDLSYGGEETRLEIGDRNVFREHVYVHRGTKSGGTTRIGSDCYLMGHAHVAHDCRLEDFVIMASGAVLGGHVEVGERAFVSGNCVVHQFVRVGRLALMRGLSRTSRDVPPFCIMDDLHVVRAINRIGLRRAGIPVERIRALQRAFAHLFGRRRHLRRALAELEAESPANEVLELLQFIRASRRGVCFGPRDSAASEAAD